jgi:hypothetical protein
VNLPATEGSDTKGDHPSSWHQFSPRRIVRSVGKCCCLVEMTGGIEHPKQKVLTNVYYL